MSDTLTHAELVRVLSYDRDTGLFHWNVTVSARARSGDLAGRANSLGYWVIKYLGMTHRAHRLAWFYVHREWPSQQIDHINGDRVDNRIANLRDVSQRVNLQNLRGALPGNKAGLLGVASRANGKFVARIRAHGKIIHLGTFLSADEAHAVYVAAKRKMHEGCSI